MKGNPTLGAREDWYLVDEKDVDPMVKYMALPATDRDSERRMGKPGRQRVMEHYWYDTSIDGLADNAREVAWGRKSSR